MSEKSWDDIWQDGHDAYLVYGLGIDTNPYLPGTEEEEAWEIGWCGAYDSYNEDDYEYDGWA